MKIIRMPQLRYYNCDCDCCNYFRVIQQGPPKFYNHPNQIDLCLGSMSKSKARAAAPHSESSSDEDEDDTRDGSYKTSSTASGVYSDRGKSEDVCLALRQSVHVFHGMNKDVFENNPTPSKEYCEYARHCIGTVWMEGVRTMIWEEMSGRPQNEISKFKTRVTNFLRPLFPGSSSTISKKLSDRMKPYVSDKDGKPLSGLLGSFIANELYTHILNAKSEIDIDDRKRYRKGMLAAVVQECGSELNSTPKFLTEPVETEMDVENNGAGHDHLADAHRAAFVRANEGKLTLLAQCSFSNFCVICNVKGLC